MAASSYSVFPARVARTEALSPTFLRVVLTGEGFEHVGDTCLDQRAKIVLPLADDGFAHFPDDENWYPAWRQLPDARRNPFRTVTVRRVRPDAREVDVDIALHGDLGPLSRWASGCRPGDPCLFVGPDARSPEAARVGLEWRPGHARRVLVAGDETAVPAIASILEKAPDDLVGDAWLEVPTDDDRLELVAPAGVTLHWLPRAGRPHGDLLVEALTGSAARAEDSEDVLWDVADAPGERYAWIAGEAGAVRTLRRHLVASGWDKVDVSFMGYWRAGRAEAS